MNNKILGTIAILSAPFLGIDFIVNGAQPVHSWTTGLYGLIYMLGWMCSVIGLQTLQATGNTRFGKVILVIQLFVLTMAQVWNMAVMFNVSQESFLFWFFDPFWPLSNICMLIVGIKVLVAKFLKGWGRFIPLAVGLWLPFSALIGFLFKGNYLPFASGFYSAIVWALLGIVIYTTKPEFKNEEVDASIIKLA